MEALECIKTRRSVRTYTGEDISDEQIRSILEAAMCAPSAGNSQTWRFIVVRDRDTLKKVLEFHPYARMLESCSAAIFVVADTNKERFAGYWVQDCSAATENLMLAAHGMGIGSVWLGIRTIAEREEGVKKLFNLPEGVEPLAIVSLGVPAEQPAQPQRFDESKIHWEKW